MRLLEHLQADARRAVQRGLAMLGAAALLVTLQIALVNRAALYQRSTGFQIAAGILFFVLLVVAVMLRWRGSVRIITEVEAALLERRRRLFDSIRAAELRSFEQLEDLAAGFTRDIEAVGALTPVIVDCLVYVVMLTGFGLYLAALAPLAALVWVLIIGVLGWRTRAEMPAERRTGAELEQAWSVYRRRVEELTRGFAQLKMDPAAAASLQRALADAMREVEAASRSHHGMVYQRPVVATTIFYLGLALFEPVESTIDPAARSEIITVLFLSFAALNFLVREAYGFSAAEAALARLDTLEQALAGSGTDESPPSDPLTTFARIELRGATFSYVEQGCPTFTVGPIDMHLTPGEVVFITGSNGSGKTTLMKLLTGLYSPGRGELLLDGRPLAPRLRESYRSLFTPVFMDHHLFGPAYGLDVADPERVEALLQRFNLAGVVRFERGRFTPLDLSTGQRKRLAMVVALLEDRPIYVLDEWAAHQDPGLRRYFYETLVPEMRAAGKTVVAISHDARFFHLADRRLNLVDGRMEES